jgi:tetratricopeptide (TPR) repeat protein
MPYSPLELANAFIQTGELPDALDALNVHLAAQPGDDDTRRLRAAVLMRLPDIMHKRAALDDLNQLGEQTISDHIKRSTLLHQLGEPERAAAAAEAAWQANPTDERVAELCLNRLLDSNFIPTARQVLARMPRSWRWLRWEAAVAEHEGDYALASEGYTDAIAALDQSTISPLLAASLRADMLLARANACVQLGALDEADADYRAAEAAIPGDPMIRFNRGLLWALRGEMIEALALCGEALAEANPALQAHMEAALRADARFGGLTALLLSGEGDI